MNSSSENESTEKKLQDIKEITVNGTVISPAEIIQEMSHHSTDSPEDMIKKSSEVLITQLLLIQKAQER